MLAPYGGGDIEAILPDDAMSADDTIHETSEEEGAPKPQRGMLDLPPWRAREVEELVRNADRAHRKGKKGSVKRALEHPKVAYLPVDDTAIYPLPGTQYRWMVNKTFAERYPSAVIHVRRNIVTDAMRQAGVVTQEDQWGRDPPYPVEYREQSLYDPACDNGRDASIAPTRTPSAAHIETTRSAGTSSG